MPVGVTVVCVCVCVTVSDWLLMLQLHSLSIISEFSTVRNNAHTRRLKPTNVSIRNPSIRPNPSDCALRSETASWTLNWFRHYWSEGIIFKLVFSNKRALKENVQESTNVISTLRWVFSRDSTDQCKLNFFFFCIRYEVIPPAYVWGKRTSTNFDIHNRNYEAIMWLCFFFFCFVICERLSFSIQFFVFYTVS